jgi:hypothetical protein
MSLKENIIKLWKTKGQILEGVTNSIFKREDVEEIAKHRMDICLFCDLYTEDNKGCMVAGTTPCCNQELGGCGCSLGFKTRSLSSECPKEHWKAELTQEEEDLINQKLGL